MNSPDNFPRRALLLAGLFVLALVGVLQYATRHLTHFVIRTDLKTNVTEVIDDKGRVHHYTGTTPFTGTARRGRGPSVATPDPHSPTPIHITAVLCEAMPAARLTAYISAAQINPDDLAEQTARALRGSTGAGAANILDLANVDHWTTAVIGQPDLQRLDSWDVKILSQSLPRAPAYLVAAYDFARHRYYTARIPAADVSTTGPSAIIDPTPATGLAVTFTHADGLGSALVARLERAVDTSTPGAAQSAGAVLHLTRRFAPELADAILEQDPILLATTGTTTLAPLPPDPAIRIHLALATGVETGPLTFRLEPGAITPLTIDCATLFPPADVTGRPLLARVMLDPPGTPLASATVTRLRADSSPADTRRTDPTGHVFFPAIPITTATTFTVETAATTTSGLPLAPPAQFVFDPATEPSDTTATATWAVTPYAYLVMPYPKDEHGQSRWKPDGERHIYIPGKPPVAPYPIFELSRDKPPGSPGPANEILPIDQFRLTDDELIIAIPTPGRYQVHTAWSPVEVHISSHADIEPGNQARVQYRDMPWTPGPGHALAVLQSNGQVYTGDALVYGYQGLPPIPLSKLKGQLPPNDERYTLTIEAPGHTPATAQVPIDDSPIVVRLE